MSKIKLGCHVGKAGKEMFLASAKEAASYGANVFMLYTGAPQNTRRKDISELNIEAGWEYARQHGIKTFYNLCNSCFHPCINVTSRMEHHNAASHCRCTDYLFFKEFNCELICLWLNQNDDDVYIALETMAGKGSEVGRTFEELKAIYDGVDKKDRLRVCFDTCHVNDAGYDIVNHYDEVFEELDKVIGLDQIAVFHINDSMNPLGAHKDRHANIDKGSIGYETLHRLVHDERFIDVPHFYIIISNTIFYIIPTIIIRGTI